MLLEERRVSSAQGSMGPPDCAAERERWEVKEVGTMAGKLEEPLDGSRARSGRALRAWRQRRGPSK